MCQKCEQWHNSSYNKKSRARMRGMLIGGFLFGISLGSAIALEFYTYGLIVAMVLSILFLAHFALLPSDVDSERFRKVTIRKGTHFKGLLVQQFVEKEWTSCACFLDEEAANMYMVEKNKNGILDVDEPSDHVQKLHSLIWKI